MGVVVKKTDILNKTFFHLPLPEVEIGQNNTVDWVYLILNSFDPLLHNRIRAVEEDSALLYRKDNIF